MFARSFASMHCGLAVRMLFNFITSRNEKLRRRSYICCRTFELDAIVRERFSELLLSVAASPDPVVSSGASRREQAVQALGRVIVLSQFSRHVLPRGRLDNPGVSEEYDCAARRIASWAIEQGLNKELRHYEKSFLYFSRCL